MACPKPELISRWTDGSLDPAEARRVEVHAARCAACAARAEQLRAVARWLGGLSESGPDCLSEAAMAAVLEGRASSDHVRSCPRCAAEFGSLKAARKTGTRVLRRRPPTHRAAWVAAAAVFVAAVAVWIATRPGPAAPPEVARAPEPLRPPPPLPDLPEPVPPPAPEPLRMIDVPAPPPPPPAPVAEPEAEPAVAPAPPAPPPTVEPKATVAEPAARKEVALQLRQGGLSTMTAGRWEKARRVEEGATLRADGRTSIEFAQARLTFDGSSRFTFEGATLALAEGGLSAEVPPGSPFVLHLGEQDVVPQAASARVLLAARADRVVVEEGAARAGGALLSEGIEHQLKKGRLEPQRRRTLASAARPRETLTWRIDFSKPEALRARLGQGTIANHPEGRALLSGAPENPAHCGAQLSYLGADEAGFITVRPGSALRFRYFLVEPAPVELVMWNLTKGENFNKPIETVAGRWTTVTLPFRDLPANPGGRKVACEPGDRFRGVGWFIGKPGTSPQMLVDRLEIVEVDR